MSEDVLQSRPDKRAQDRERSGHDLADVETLDEYYGAERERRLAAPPSHDQLAKVLARQAKLGINWPMPKSWYALNGRRRRLLALERAVRNQ